MRDKTIIKKITASATLTVFAAICGILEGILPLRLALPIPGVKLGIANIFIVFAFRFLGKGCALAVTISRVLIVFIFSGNAVSLVLSLSGGFLSYFSLIIMMSFYGKIFSFIGISAMSAVFHGIGQLVASIIIVGDAVVYYIPIMLTACAVTGIFTGTLMNVSEKKAAALFYKV